MGKYNTLEDAANDYVKANRLKSLSAQENVKRNFLSLIKNNYPTIQAKQIEFVAFDMISIVVNNELVDIEL